MAVGAAGQAQRRARGSISAEHGRRRPASEEDGMHGRAPHACMSSPRRQAMCHQYERTVIAVPPCGSRAQRQGAFKQSSSRSRRGHLNRVPSSAPAQRPPTNYLFLTNLFFQLQQVAAAAAASTFVRRHSSPSFASECQEVEGCCEPMCASEQAGRNREA